MKKLLIRNGSRLLAIALALVLYALTLPPKPTGADLDKYRSDFRFTSATLHEPNTTPAQVRVVHPQYEHISAWISSVGAAITITDFDGDALFNDLVHVDPRFDKVFVSPAPGTGERFHPFSLDPELAYDPATMAPMGSLSGDFDEDGDLDLLVYYWGRTPILFYREEAGYRQVELSAEPARWFTNAATTADFDGDGRIDILICNYFPDGARVLDAGATDRDQVMQHSMTRADNGSLNHMFLGGEQGYEEDPDWYRSFSYPLDWTLGVAAADIDGDLLPEIYVANDFGPDKLLHNRSKPGALHFGELKGKKRFRTINSAVVGGDSFKGMGADFGDIDGDGLLDIYVSNIADEYALLESHFTWIHTGDLAGMRSGHAPYVNRSESLGMSRSSWGWDSKLADLNNDGLPEGIQATGFVKGETDRWPELQELAMGNDELLAKPEAWPRFQPGDDLSGYEHNPLFARDDQGYFFDIAELAGTAEQQVTRGIAISDFEHDGDLDFVVANQWEPSRAYQNERNGKDFLGIQLTQSLDRSITAVQVDPLSQGLSRPAIGAVAELKAAAGNRIDYVDGGNGHSGVDSPELFFGLSETTETAHTVELNWRDRDGQLRSADVELLPGWHTIVLP